MGVFIYFVLALFCWYMAFELGRYVIATGDALPIIIVSLLVLLSIHCIRQVYKAIKNKDLDILDWINVPRGTKYRKVLGFRGGFEGGLGVAWWGTNKQGKTPTNKGKHQQTRENTNKQEKTPTNKGNTFRARGTPFKQEKYISGKENAFQARGIFRSNVKVCKW